MLTNQQIILANHPEQKVQAHHFQLVSSPLGKPAVGEVLIQNQWLSVDPYMKGRINSAKSYAKNVAIGEVMIGEVIGKVVESNSTRFKVGDTVIGMMGWQTHALMPDEKINHLPNAEIPATCFLGVAGMPGITAWLGIHQICKPRSGETLLVNAAIGAVGSVVGQLAKKLGCRIIGIASTVEKCEYAKVTLGFDECISHQDANLHDTLSKVAPNGIDCLFENVGGALFDTVFPHLNSFARIALCGLVSEDDFYQTHPVHLRGFLNKRLHLQAFIAFDYFDEWPSIQAQLISFIADQSLRYTESISKGIESAPNAFIGMLNGHNIGKQLVKLD